MNNIEQGVVFVVLLFVVQFPVISFADDTESGVIFISGSFVTGVSDIEDIQNTGAITGTPSSSEMDDAVGGFAGALGYQWSQFQVEAEYLWRYRFDFDNRFSGGPTGIKSDIQTQSVMVNFRWFFYDQWVLKPYVGAGVGWIENEADTRRTNISTGTITNLETSTDDLTWALTAGVIYPVNDDWKIKVGYRFADLGEVEIGPFADGGKVTIDEYDSHDFTLSVMYFF